MHFILTICKKSSQMSRSVEGTEHWYLKMNAFFKKFQKLISKGQKLISKALVQTRTLIDF